MVGDKLRKAGEDFDLLILANLNVYHAWLGYKTFLELVLYRKVPAPQPRCVNNAVFFKTPCIRDRFSMLITF